MVLMTKMACPPPPRLCDIAIIGTGIAGATCARILQAAGHAVRVVDKSRGAGGRMATKRLQWTDAQGATRQARVDHGAPGFAAEDPGFADFARAALGPAGLSAWTPALKAGSRPLPDAGTLLLPQPDMPALCRALLQGMDVTWSFQVDRLLRDADGCWQLEAAGALLPGRHDHLVLALPPAQAAPLLAPHAPAWAAQAAQAVMEPCWTLMGVAQRPAQAGTWDLAQPAEGPLAWVMRADARPGRAAAADEAHWVAHASPSWSRAHLEQPAAWVQTQLAAALEACAGEAIAWKYLTAHRWRYARPGAPRAAGDTPYWWDPALGLGVCGDFLGGASVGDAWRSAQRLGAAMRSR